MPAYFFFLDFFTFFTMDFLAFFLGFARGEGRQRSSRFEARRPHESQIYFKLTVCGAHTCLGLPVMVPQNLHVITFSASLGLQR